MLSLFLSGSAPLKLTAYDGSTAGESNAQLGLHLESPRALSYLLTAPGELGIARAYVAGELTLIGTHPGDPYRVLASMIDRRNFRRPGILELAAVVRRVAPEVLRNPVRPPVEETLPEWRRLLTHGLRHSTNRDADSIQHHYDASNRFYERMLGESMTYTCAVYPDATASLEEAQENKHRIIFEKLDLKPGDHLLDIGCGWGSLVRYAAKRGIRTTGVTLSAEQAAWARAAIKNDGLDELAQVVISDYRHVTGTYDAITSVGMTEHIGVRHYPEYFRFFLDHLRPTGRFINHCITRSVNTGPSKGRALMHRYVFPDGELTGSGTVITAAQDVGLEVLHEENLRPHYAMTLRDWNRNLVHHWDAATDELGPGRARVWSLMLAGGRLGFDRNRIQVHQILGVRPDLAVPATDLPLQQWWTR